MFAFYVALTKAKQPSFKQFLSDGNDGLHISDKFLCDKLKCLHLFKYFYEAKEQAICDSIQEAKIFDGKHGKEVDFDVESVPLVSSDVECIALFLTCSSHKEWTKVDLFGCYIQDDGLHTLHDAINCSRITIQTLGLSRNGLTTSSLSFIRDITISCAVKRLWIDGNDIGDVLHQSII